MHLGFEHTYAGLSPRFYRAVEPARAADPQLVIFNTPLAAQLGLDPDAIQPVAAALFSGKELPADARPIAMAYAGHQFGGFAPRLGDGRAILLGEIKGRDGFLYDIQLKGAGLTPFSRNGDGRAALGPMLREYIISEAMFALGVPTTRSLAVVTTGERVYRESAVPGAVLTRVAASHVRVGTFQYFASRGEDDAVRELLDYVIARHYPAARAATVPALAVLQAVIARQASLIAQWMLLGFIHGVMNTDNMALSGETIDYGPCAFMDSFHPETVFSSIDHGGRYAYANQATIAQWNLTRFAETLLPHIDADADKAIALATQTLESFMTQFDERFLAGMRRKIGLASAAETDSDLVRRLLAAMQDGAADFTLTFRYLAEAAESAEGEAALRALFTAPAQIDGWLRDWRQRLELEKSGAAVRARDMRSINPAFIPRNHRVEAALQAASDDNDSSPLRRLLEVLAHPYEDQPEHADYMRPPQESERVLQTFCGT